MLDVLLEQGRHCAKALFRFSHIFSSVEADSRGFSVDDSGDLREPDAMRKGDAEKRKDEDIKTIKQFQKLLNKTIADFGQARNWMKHEAGGLTQLKATSLGQTNAFAIEVLTEMRSHLDQILALASPDQDIALSQAVRKTQQFFVQSVANELNDGIWIAYHPVYRRMHKRRVASSYRQRDYLLHFLFGKYLG